MPDRQMVSSAARTIVRMNAVWLAGVIGATAIVYALIETGLAIGGSATALWASVSWVLQWAALAAGFGVASCLPVLVAGGLTRRAAALGGMVAVAVLATGMALLVQIGLVVEWVALTVAGYEHRLGDGGLFGSVGEVHLVLAHYGLQFAGFVTTGWLIHAGYHRGGVRWGTALLPLALVPAIGSVLAVSTGWPAGSTDAWPWAGTLPASVASGLALAPILAGLWAIWGLTRDMPISTR